MDAHDVAVGQQDGAGVDTLLDQFAQVDGVAPLAALDGPVIAYATIYGTFVVEGLIGAALLTRRYRHVGIAAGMAFHLLLSLSAYAMYISFTTLALALHTLFLNERAARAVLDSPAMAAIRARLAGPIYKFAVLVLVLSLAAFAFAGQYTFATLAAPVR